MRTQNCSKEGKGIKWAGRGGTWKMTLLEREKKTKVCNVGDGKIVTFNQ